MTRFEDLPSVSERQVRPTAAFTFAGLIDAVNADAALSPTRRRDLKSAISSFCKRLHIVPMDTSASMDTVAKRIDGVHPKQIGLKPKRWQNIVAELRFALDRYGPKPVRTLRAADLPAPWDRLLVQLPAPGLRYGLSRLIKFCVRSGIDPAQVDASTIDAFGEWLTDHTLCPQPHRKAREAARRWNAAVDRVPDWPGRPIALAPARAAYCLPWDAMPEAFRLDAEDWLRSLGLDSWAAETAPLRPLRPSSIGMRRFQIRQAFSILVQCGQAPESITGLADLVRPECAERILTFFWQRSGERPSSQAAGMAHCLLSLARHRVKLDALDLRKLQRLKQRVTPRPAGLTAKNRATLRAFEDERNKERLLMFPTDTMQRAKRMSNRSPVKAALLAQTAAAVEILIMMPLRLRNLATLHLEENFEWRGSRRFVIIPPESVKNDEPIEFELLGPSATMIEDYRDRFRPILSNGSGYLFPGTVPDRPKNPTHLSRQITKTLFDATGLRMTPHQFRHVAAKIWLDDNPGSYEVVRRVLHHRSIDTTTANYTGFETRSAALQYDAFVLKQRRRFLGMGDGEDG